MKLFSLILFAFLFVPKCKSLAGIQRPDCGRTFTNGSNIQVQPSTSPRDLLQSELPWLVGVEVEETVGNETHQDNVYEACVGVVINEFWVLAPAMCFNVDQDDARITSITVFVEINKHPSDSYQGSRIRVRPDSFFVHPDYDLEDEYNDLALIKTESPIPMKQNATHYLVNGICLPEVGQTEQTTGSYSIAFADEGDPLIIGSSHLVGPDDCEDFYIEVLEENNQTVDFESPLIPEDVQSKVVCRVSGSEQNICIQNGGLVMNLVNNRWQLAGLLTGYFSPPEETIPNYECDQQSRVVDVVMRIDGYTDWIQSTILGHPNPQAPQGSILGTVNRVWIYGILAAIAVILIAGICCLVMIKNRQESDDTVNGPVRFRHQTKAASGRRDSPQFRAAGSRPRYQPVVSKSPAPQEYSFEVVECDPKNETAYTPETSFYKNDNTQEQKTSVYQPEPSIYPNKVGREFSPR